MGIPKTLLVPIVLLKLLIVDTLAIEYAPVVDTTNGPVIGAVLKTAKLDQQYLAYKNIRYGKAPVGYLRFKPPVEPEPWTEVMNATEYGPMCPQPSFEENPNGYDGDEDCLNLSVFTPSLSNVKGRGSLRPVMFWIFGGSYTTGDNRKTMYGPDYLIEEGAVVVIPNHRLGILGFLALGHPNATGNAGLKDQNLALRWVRDNIAKFGGDPNKVTIFGQSSGAACVELQMLSKRSKGLFHRSIAMSGTSVSVWSTIRPEDARNRAFQLAKNVGHETTEVESLLKFYYEADVKTLIDASNNLISTDIPFKPTIEDPSLGSKEDLFLTQCPVKLLNTGDYAQVPRMIGYTKDEVLFDAAGGDLNITAMGAIELLKYYGMENALQQDIAPLQTNYDLNTGVAILSDILFIAPAHYSQQLTSQWKSPVYFYRYNYDHEKSFHKILFNFPVNGSAHTDDLPMIFTGDYEIDPKANDTPALVQSRMTRMWANFAKFGNPTPYDDSLLDNFHWPDSRANGDMLDITDRLDAVDRLTSERIERILSALRAAVPSFGCRSSSKYPCP